MKLRRGEKKRRASPRESSKKSREFERDAAKAMSDMLGVEVMRRVVGEEAQKGDLGRDLNGCQPFAVQVKYGTTFSITGALEEAAMACDKTYTIPLAITRRVGSVALVTLMLSDFVRLVKVPSPRRKARGEGLPQMVDKAIVATTKKGEQHVQPEEESLELQ